MPTALIRMGWSSQVWFGSYFGGGSGWAKEFANKMNLA